MNKLRLAEFTLEENIDLGIMDFEYRTEYEKATEIKNGYFHCFGNIVEILNGENIPIIYGIIEDIKTKQIYHVIPRRIKFLD